MFGNAALTMVNIWATWCPSCIDELPNIQQLYSAYYGRVQVVTILEDASAQTDSALQILNELGVTVPVIRCNKSVRAAFGAHADLTMLPVTFFVDSNGHILKTVYNAQSYDKWCSIINGLL